MTFLRVIGFSVVVLLVFTGFANILPQVQSDPPGASRMEPGTLDMAGLIALGEQLFSGRGTCNLCHVERGRAPDLLNLELGAEIAARLADPRYRGPQDAERYLRDSLVAPSAYVVAGYGKKGSNDTESPMPAVDRPPIGLNPAEIAALTAYLMDLAGLEPGPDLLTIAAGAVGGDTGGDTGADTGGDTGGDSGSALARTGPEAIEKFFCAACHDLEGSGADLGPGLAGIGARLGAGGIMEAILDPDAFVPAGYEPGIMPADFAGQMQASELVLLTDYLMNLPE